jgi:FkbM family methyltransferase
MHHLSGFSVGKDIFGCSYLLDLGNPIDRSIYMFKQFEGEEVKGLSQIAKDMNANCFIDVGANIGVYTLAMAKNSMVKEIYAFEPNSGIRSQLQANLYLNGIEESVSVFPVGLSNHKGVENFVLSEGMSHICPKSKDEMKTVSIQVERLDDLLTISGRQIVVKMDIEGHEQYALKGMGNLLRNNKVLVQIEVFKSNIEKVRTIFVDLGYRELEWRSLSGMDRYFTNFESSLPI